MSNREKIRAECDAIYEEGARLAVDFEMKKENNFQFAYQIWYSKALKIIKLLGPDRCEEFKKYYESDLKRKKFDYGTYAIQDYFMNIQPSFYATFDSRAVTKKRFFTQLTILKSIQARFDSVIDDIESALASDFEDSELHVAHTMLNTSLRAAGAIAGVVTEGHLKKVAKARSVQMSKKNLTISDLNEALKAASLIDLPTWRKITYLGDIRNICVHKKDVEPTKEQVRELLDGAAWVTKNVF